MYKSILVPVDGSEHAEKALAFASELAEKWGASLTVLNVVTGAPLSESERALIASEHLSHMEAAGVSQALIKAAGNPLGMPQLIEETADFANRVRQEFGRAILNQAKNAANDHGVTNVETVLEEGDPTKVILAVAKRLGVDMIAMGSRGLGDLEGLLLGSVSHKVGHSADCTVLTVR